MGVLFDVAVDGLATAGATSLTWAHTCTTDADRLLRVGFIGDLSAGADDVSSVAYSGVGLTLVAKNQGTAERWLYLYELVAPATGTNNVVVTFASSHFIAGASASYTGTMQTGQPDASSTEDSVTNVTSQTETVTTTADNSWLQMVGYGGNGTLTDDGGTSSVVRVINNQFVMAMFDSGGPKTPAQAHTITFNAANAHLHSVTAAIRPSGGGGGGGAGVGRRALLGVGR